MKKKNLTSRFPVLSDKLVLVVHLLLASVNILHHIAPDTSVSRGAASILRRRDPSRVATRDLNVSINWLAVGQPFDSNFLNIIMIVEQGPFDLDPVSLIYCEKLVFRRSTILPWIFTVDQWMHKQQVWVRDQCNTSKVGEIELMLTFSLLRGAR